MVKINNSSKLQVLIRFLQISGVTGAKIDVSMRYLLHLSPGVKIIKRNDMLTHLLSVSIVLLIVKRMSTQTGLCKGGTLES